MEKENAISQYRFDDLLHEKNSEFANFQKEFKKNKICVIRNLIKPEALRLLQAYFQSLVRFGALKRDDRQCKSRYQAYKDPLANEIQPLFENFVGKLVGSPVKSSYNYLAVYLPGAVLKPHKDREQCKYTLDLAINIKSDGELYLWPLYVGKKKVSITSVLFMGCNLKHYRKKLPNGNVITNLFLHYVDAKFMGSLN